MGSDHQSDTGQRRGFWFGLLKRTLMLLYGEALMEFPSASATRSAAEKAVSQGSSRKQEQGWRFIGGGSDFGIITMCRCADRQAGK